MNQPARFAGWLLLSLLTGCHGSDEQRHAVGFFVFGTTVSLQFDAPANEAAAIEAQISRHLAQRHRDWHAWEPGALTQLNLAIARGETAAADPSLVALIQAGQQLSAQSHGLFDPGVGRLVAMWGFHTSDYPIRTPKPDAQAIAEYLQSAPGIADLDVSSGRVQSRKREVSLDFGGIAKGMAADEVLSMLKQAGVQRALIELGGDVTALNSSKGEPWRVGIRDPAHAQPLAGVVLADGESLFTSGTYARHALGEGERASHILDPRSGMPAHGLRSATVLERQAMRADAGATALIVAGSAWRQTAVNMHLAAVLVIDDEGRCWVTQEMKKRLISRSKAGQACKLPTP